MRIIYFLLVLVFSMQVHPKDDLLIDVSSIAGKPISDSKNALGEPELCIKKFVEDILSCSFKNRNVEIYFVNGLADWITIKVLGDHPRKIGAARLIGLEADKSARPVLSTSLGSFYEPYMGYRSLNLAGSPEKLNYISLKVKTLNYGQFTSSGNMFPWNVEKHKKIKEYFNKRNLEEDKIF